MRNAIAGLAVAAPFVLGWVTGAAPPQGTPVFSFGDDAITEASALVAQDGLFLTSNDSGDEGRVFAVDDTGTTVGVTYWADAPTDVEALAPGRPGYIWVGDIGDNLAQRTSISVTEVPVGRGDRHTSGTTYRLSYPHTHSDAETLIRNPRTGQLLVATKNVFAGELYAAPRQPSTTATNLLRPVGQVLPMATDGAFFPDGRHVIIRNYTTAAVYRWPSLRRVATFELPGEDQGEGITVAGDDRVYVSSEGAHSTVLRVSLPPKVQREVAASGPTSSSSPSSHADDSSAADPSSPVDPTSHEVWPWLAGGLLALVALVLLLRAVRPPSG